MHRIARPPNSALEKLPQIKLIYPEENVSGILMPDRRLQKNRRTALHMADARPATPCRPRLFRKVVPEGGFEPPTPRFSIVCSTPELLGHCFSGGRLMDQNTVGEGAYGERQCAWQGLTSRALVNFNLAEF